jgi:hypothetical protein
MTSWKPCLSSWATISVIYLPASFHSLTYHCEEFLASHQIINQIFNQVSSRGCIVNKDLPDAAPRILKDDHPSEFSEPQMATLGGMFHFWAYPYPKPVSLYIYIYIVIKSKIGLVQVHSPNSQTSFYGYVFLPHTYIYIYIYLFICVCITCVIYFHHQNLETSPGAGPLKESLGVAVCGLRGHLTCKA